MDMLRGGWGPGMMGNGLVVASGPDVTAPTAVTFTPADNATLVSTVTNLVVLLSEDCVLGTGNITLKKTSDNSTIEAWDVATEAGTGAGQVNIAASRLLTMRLTTALAAGTEFYVIWDAGVVKDAANNSVAANASTTLWSFTTGAGATDYDPAAEAIFAAFTTPPTTVRKNQINTVVAALKTAGIWTSLDALYVMAAADSQAAKINWKAPGTYNATEVNAPAFAVNRGFTGASTKYLDSGMLINTGGLNYVRDSASAFAWSLTDANLGNGMIGTTTTSIVLNPRFADTFPYARITNATTNLTVAVAQNGTGLLSVTRSGATASELFKNGMSLTTGVGASIAPAAVTAHILRSNTTYWNGEIAVAGLGSHLDAAAQTALYDAFAGYMAVVGDVTAPTVTSLTPIDNATSVSPTANLVVVFNETVTLGATGHITLKRTSDNVTVEDWDVTTEGGSTAGKVEVVAGTNLTMHLTTGMAGGVEHYVIWDAGVVKDVAGNLVAAQASTTAWSFSVAYDAATDSIAAAFTTPPTTARKNLIDVAVVALKTAGVWAKLDALYLLAAADSQAALINWKAPGTYNCTEVNAPTFTADQGFTGASTKYLDSGFNPSTAPTPKFVQDDASAFGWSLTDASINGGIVGVASGVTLGIFPRFTGPSAYYAINTAAATSIANASGLGLYCAVRTGASAKALYKSGTSISTSSATSVAVPNQSLLFLRRNVDYWTGVIAAGGFGQQLDATENTALYNALRTYLTGVGLP